MKKKSDGIWWCWSFHPLGFSGDTFSVAGRAVESPHKPSVTGFMVDIADDFTTGF